MSLVMELTPAAAVPARSDGGLDAVVARLQNGDDSALESFVQATQKLALNLAWHLLRDYHAAQDAVQDAYLSAFRTIRSLRDRRAARAWFLRIVSNRCIAVMRKQQGRPQVELPEDLVDDACLEETSGRRLAVRQALDGLAPPDRTIILLRESLDLPYEDIATVLAIPVGTVKSRLNEARRRLAQRLSKEGLQ